jgi:hypothetical protein
MVILTAFCQRPLSSRLGMLLVSVLLCRCRVSRRGCPLGVCVFAPTTLELHHCACTPGEKEKEEVKEKKKRRARKSGHKGSRGNGSTRQAGVHRNITSTSHCDHPTSHYFFSSSAKFRSMIPS